MVLEIYEVLSDLGFRSTIRKSAESWVAAIYGEEQLELWMETIGSHNIKHLTKYLLWKRQGSVPPGTTVPQRLELLHLSSGTFLPALRAEAEVAQWL